MRNKKKTFIWALTLIFTLSAVPFGYVKAEESNSGTEAKIVFAPIRGITVNKLNPYVLNEKEENTVFDGFQKEIESLKTQEGYYVFDNEKYGIKDSNVYVLISLGQRNTGGYGLKVISAEDNEGISAITIEETKPAPDMMVAQVITYPYVIVRFSQGTPNVTVETTNGVQFNPLLASDELNESGWNDFNTRINTPANKEWRIIFNRDVAGSYINNNTIYVRDSKGRLVPTELHIEKDKKTVRVIPQEAYAEGETYCLFISDKINGKISSRGTVFKGYRMKFIIEANIIVQ
jgi:hypothetical protein